MISKTMTTRAAKIVATAFGALAIGMGAQGVASAHDWSGVAQCESGGNWHINTSNGYEGGLQFTRGTWYSNGGHGSPANAPRWEQERVAENVLRTQGRGAWPVCGAYLR
jgi:resuscitation-promoting factor RpfE